MDEIAPDRRTPPSPPLDGVVGLARRALAAVTLAEVWGDVAGFLAVELDAAEVIAVEGDPERGAARVRAVSGAATPRVGERIDADALTALVAPDARPAEVLPWPLPEPVHVAAVAAPGDAGVIGALLVARPAVEPGATLQLAAHLLGAATGRLQATARSLKDSALLARATASLSRARGVEATRRAALRVLAGHAPRSVLWLVDRHTGQPELHAPEMVEAERLVAAAGLAEPPEATALTHGADGATIATVPLRVGRARVGALVLELDRPLEAASERVPLLETLADRVALSLHNAWLLEEARREAEGHANLLAVVSHDLRNPLASIMLHAEALRRRVARGDAHGIEEVLADILSAGRQMDRLIRDLRDVEAARRGRLGIELRRCALDALLRETLSTWGPRAEQAGVRLVWSPEPDAPSELACDPARVRQAVDNLLSNALSVTPTGGTVEVATVWRGDEVHIRVSDSGPGVPEHAREAIFESFYRGEHARYAGLGLGLAIARSIVQLHHGALELDSRPGEGACFTIRLPVRAI